MTIKTFLLKFLVILFLFTGLKGMSQALSPISPKKGLVLNNDSIFLRWNKLNNAQFYELKYTTDSTFISNINTVNVGLQTSYWLSPLMSNTTYYWRVEGNNGTATFIGQTRKFTNFKPTDMPGCALWLRADTGIVLNGSTVQTWHDASANAYNVTQSTASAQPAYQLNMINGFPALSFDGNDVFVLGNFPYGANNHGFIVAKKTNLTVPHGIVISGPYFDFEMSTLRCAVNYAGILGANFNAYKWSQISLKRKSGDSKVTLNGVQAGAGDIGVLIPVSIGNLAIGNRNPIVNSPAPLRGEISEIVINTYDLNDEQTNKIQNYLMDKYTFELSAGNDTIVADNFCPITISATSGFGNYLWSTGDTTQSIIVSKSGTYFVQSSDLFERIQIDSMIVSYPEVNQLNVSVLCYGNQINWNTNLSSPYSFLWQNNSVASNFLIDQPGTYYVKVTDNYGCDFFSDTVAIALDNFPNIAFIGNDTSLCSGNTLQLQNGANSATNYLWSNGIINDSLVIATGGTYWLEVSNINNCIARDTINIILTGIAPNADFFSEDICIGLPMQFTDLTTTVPNDTIVSWEWTFADGNLSNLQNPINLYAVANNYLVSLKAVSQTSCAGVINKMVTVYPHPNLNFTVINNCNGKLANFTDNSNPYGGTIYNLEWNFNDSLSINNNANGINVSHNFSQNSVYQVQLILNTLEGCIDTILKPILIKPSPIAAIDYSKLCLGDTVKFQDISYMPFPQQNIYRKWTFTDSIFSTNYKPFMWYNTTGNYQVQLEIMASNGCRDTVLSQIEISNVPEAGFIIENACLGALTTFIDTSICENCVLSLWNWTFNGLSFGANANVNYNFENIGIYEVNLKVENSAGCEHEISQNVNITALPEALFSVNSSFGSPPFELDLTNLSNNNLQFYWSFGDGSISNLFEPNYTYNDTGIFKLTLIVNDLNGCIDSASSNIQLLPKKIDVALTNVNLNNSNGYIHSEILIINLGTTTVNTFDILMSSNGNANNLVERWEGVLVPGELKQYTLRNSFKQEENYNITDYICYQIQNIDKGSDSNLANNKQCVVLNPDEFKFTSLYPNPGNENIKLSVISPFSDNITIDFIDYTGALVLSINQKVTVGFNLLNVETFTLADGVYKCRINSRNNYFIQNFVKIKN